MRALMITLNLFVMAMLRAIALVALIVMASTHTVYDKKNSDKWFAENVATSTSTSCAVLNPEVTAILKRPTPRAKNEGILEQKDVYYADNRDIRGLPCKGSIGIRLFNEVIEDYCNLKTLIIMKGKTKKEPPMTLKLTFGDDFNHLIEVKVPVFLIHPNYVPDTADLRNWAAWRDLFDWTEENNVMIFAPYYFQKNLGKGNPETWEGHVDFMCLDRIVNSDGTGTIFPSTKREKNIPASYVVSRPCLVAPSIFNDWMQLA